MKNSHTCLNSVIYNDNSYEKLTSGKLRDFNLENFVGTLFRGIRKGTVVRFARFILKKPVILTLSLTIF